MGIWTASVRRWLADIVAGHGREDAYLELPGRRIEPRGQVSVPDSQRDDTSRPG